MPYDLSSVGGTRSRAMLTTANLDPSDPAYHSLPRVQTAHGMRAKQSLGNLSQQNYGGYQRGHSAHVRMGVGGSAMPLINQAENLDENRVVLYKKSK